MKRPSSEVLSLMHNNSLLEKEAWSRKDLFDQGYKKIAVIDDCPKTTSLIRTYLREMTMSEILTFNDEFDALRSIASERPDLILLDIQLQFIDGRKLSHILKEINCDQTPIIFMSLDHRLLRNSQYSLQKPLKKDGLQKYLEQVLSETRYHGRTSTKAS